MSKAPIHVTFEPGVSRPPHQSGVIACFRRVCPTPHPTAWPATISTCHGPCCHPRDTHCVCGSATRRRHRTTLQTPCSSETSVRTMSVVSSMHTMRLEINGISSVREPRRRRWPSSIDHSPKSRPGASSESGVVSAAGASSAATSPTGRPSQPTSVAANAEQSALAKRRIFGPPRSQDAGARRIDRLSQRNIRKTRVPVGAGTRVLESGGQRSGS